MPHADGRATTARSSPAATRASSDTYDLDVHRPTWRASPRSGSRRCRTTALPNRGPGRVYYEGPFGDFFLSEFDADDRRQAGEARRRRPQTSATANTTPRTRIDGDPQTGWSINGGQGKAHATRSSTSPSRSPSRGARPVELLFEQLLRRRPRPVPRLGDDRPRAGEGPGLPGRVEALLLVPTRVGRAEQRDASATTLPARRAGTEGGARRDREAARGNCRTTRRRW